MGSFSADITRFTEKTKKSIDVVVKEVVVQGFASVTRRSPVLTGRFRSNWNIAQNRVDTSYNLSGIAPEGVIFGTPMVVAELVKVAAVLENAEFEDTGFFAISNNIPYALNIERGFSKASPGGVLHPAFLELKGKIEEIIKSKSKK